MVKSCLCSDSNTLWIVCLIVIYQITLCSSFSLLPKTIWMFSLAQTVAELRSLKDSLENAPTARVVKNKNKIKVNIKPSTRKNNINTESQRRRVWKGLETVFYFLCYQCNCLLWVMQSLFLLNYYREFLAKLNESVLVYVSRCFNVFVW